MKASVSAMGWFTKACAFLLVVALAGSARGQEPIDATHEANADATIEIDNLSGSVTLSGWDKKEVKVTGTLGEGAERLELSGDADRLRIEVVLPRKAKHVDPSDLVIKVPRGARVQIGTVNADVSVGDFAGRLSVDTVNGDVEITEDPSEIDVDTVSGDIHLKTACADVETSSVSGEIRLEGLNGEASVESVSGDVEVGAGSLERFRYNTVSGDLEFSCEPRDDGRYEFASQSGDINLHLPKKLSARFEISTFSGSIENEFGEAAQRKSKFVPSQELNFSVGDGKASFEIETFSGDVELLAR